MKIYKIREQTIWHWSYRWTDDHAYNLGYDDLSGNYIGTKKEFEEWCEAEQWGQGFYCWKVKKKHATEKEVKESYYCGDWTIEDIKEYESTKM